MPNPLTQETRDKIANTLRNKPETLSTEYNGFVYGRLTVLSELPRTRAKNGQKIRILECLCSCGNTAAVRLFLLKKGVTQSCGCLAKELTIRQSSTHGLSKTKLYHSWLSMRARCDKPQNQDYHNYGGRGIEYCDKWKAFKKFHEDMVTGFEPGLTLDRIDCNGNYEKANCRWATQQVQQANRRNALMVEYKGQTIRLKDLCASMDVPYHRIWQRLNRYNMSLEQALA